MKFPIKDIDGNILEHQTIVKIGDVKNGIISIDTEECTYQITLDFYLELVKYNRRFLND